MQIETEHLDRVQAAVDELQAIVEQQPDAAGIGAAWDAVGRVIRALGDLAPNHPVILQHRSALAVPVGRRR